MNEKFNNCPDCNGDGYNIWSCCGDDMKLHLPESDLCPTCYEHTGGEDDKEKCDSCNGTGVIQRKQQITGNTMGNNINLRMAEIKVAQKNKLLLQNKKVCFTGTLSRLTRLEAYREVTKVGGISYSNITKDTDLLIIGHTLQKTTKQKKAINYGIKMIDESIFYDVINL